MWYSSTVSRSIQKVDTNVTTSAARQKSKLVGWVARSVTKHPRFRLWLNLHYCIVIKTWLSLFNDDKNFDKNFEKFESCWKCFSILKCSNLIFLWLVVEMLHKVMSTFSVRLLFCGFSILLGYLSKWYVHNYNVNIKWNIIIKYYF